MSAPATFDPTAYVAEMRSAGVVLTPYTITTGATAGRRVFSIGTDDGGGIPGDVLQVGTKWESAALAHPGWIAAVHDALMAEVRT